MGVIVKNGVSYGSSSIIFSNNAQEIVYDDNTSKVGSTTVQGAIDKLKTLVDSKETVGAASTALSSAKSYTDTAVNGVKNTIPNITYGTTDLTAGTSQLAAGTFYFVYE